MTNGVIILSGNVLVTNKFYKCDSVSKKKYITALFEKFLHT